MQLLYFNFHKHSCANIELLLFVPQIKAIKGRVLLIGAGRYHTAMCTSSELYTVGKNLGQLGYEKTYDTQILPRTVWCKLRVVMLIIIFLLSRLPVSIWTRMIVLFTCPLVMLPQQS